MKERIRNTESTNERDELSENCVNNKENNGNV